MADTFKCPVEGCAHAPFKNLAGLNSHISIVHKEYKPGGKEAREVPIVEEDFATLLQKFGIKGTLAANIAENVSHTGGPKVFEVPELLFKRLNTWSSDITPAKRKNIIEQWFAEKGIDISPEVLQKVGMTPDQISKTEEGTKEGTGVRYVFDEEKRVVRMAKKDEGGGTLSEAKELLKMADVRDKEEVESPFIQNEDGHWVLNPKARVTGVELMASQFMQQAQAKGEPVDPITAMTRAAETWKTLREGLGGGASTQPAWMTDPLAFVEAIKTISGGAGGDSTLKALPTWMTDPLAFVEAIKTISGGTGGDSTLKALPTWMTDPLAFVEAIKTISGGTGGDSTLKDALAEMKKSMDELKEQRWQDQFTGQQKQIQDLANVLKQTLDTIADLQKGKVGRTEMDIIHDIASGGMDFLKTELPGMRKDIREALGSAGLPPGKTTEEREGRKQRVKKALETDKDIEDLGQRLFFPQG